MSTYTTIMYVVKPGMDLRLLTARGKRGTQSVPWFFKMERELTCTILSSTKA